MPTEHKKKNTIVLEQDGYYFLNTLVLQSDFYDVEKNIANNIETEETKKEKAELDAIIRIGAHTPVYDDKQKIKKQKKHFFDIVKTDNENSAPLIFKKIDSKGVVHVYSYKNNKIRKSPHIVRVDENNKQIHEINNKKTVFNNRATPRQNNLTNQTLFYTAPKYETHNEGFFKTLFLILKNIKNIPSTIFSVFFGNNIKIKRETLVFSLVSVLLILPIYYGNYMGGMFERFGLMKKTVSEAVAYLGAIPESNKTPSSMTTKLSYAAMSFDTAYSMLREYNSTIINISKKIPFAGSTIELGETLLKTGKQISDASQSLAGVLATMSFNDEDVPLTEILVKMRADILVSKKSLSEAGDILINIKDSSIPNKYKEPILIIKESLPSIENFVSKTDAMLLALINLLGHYEKKKYIFIFQNSAEIRPTGGFIGSFAETTLDRGKISNIVVPGGGTYDTKGGLTTRVFSPEPLGLIAPRWYMWDSNWWPDFPTSANKIMWFYEKSGESSVDGVIAVNSDIIEKLLILTGPIEMPEYNKTITSENFYKETQSAVEIEYDKDENKPKKFIGDLMPKILDRIFNTKEENLLPLLSLFYEGFTQKNIQIYSKDAKTQEYINNLGWSGKIQPAEKDYLMVVHTNIGGGKSDAVISTNIHQKADIQTDGKIINTVEITRRHNGPSNMIYTDTNNVDYIRIYVPKGSKLISVSGQKPPKEDLFKQEELFALNTDSDINLIEKNSKKDQNTGTDISEQFDKTVFGNWIQTAPFTSSTIIFSYELPFSIFNENQKGTGSYSLYIQKQSGVDNSHFINSVDISKTKLNPEWFSSSNNAKNNTPNENLITCEGVLSEDIYCTSVFKNKY